MFFDRPRFLLIIAVVTLTIAVFLARSFGLIMKPEDIHLGLHGSPYSTDPMKYDAMVHHICFRSAYGSLASFYSYGRIQPIIAESWSVDRTQTQWTFKIRADLKFENGDPISAEAVYLSIKRALFKIYESGTRTGFVPLVEGIERLKSLGQPLSGLSFSNTEVIIRLTQPYSKFLEDISFGNFAIAHQSQWDHTGNWKDEKRLISSGAYRISNWTTEGIELTLRKEWPGELTSKNPPAHVKVSFNSKPVVSADLIYGTSLDGNRQHLKFWGSNPGGIRYILLPPWNHPDSPLKDRSIRQNLRDIIVSTILEDGGKLPTRFFPNSSFAAPVPSSKPWPDSHPRMRIRYRIPDTSICTAPILKAIERLRSPNLEFIKTDSLNKDWLSESDSNLKTYGSDLSYRGSAVLLASPWEDIKFMFLSKQGIKLPDPTGNIKAELNRPNPDLNVIEKQLYDDAIVWPICHFTPGVWHSEKVDLSEYNPAMPPIDLSWVNVD